MFCAPRPEQRGEGRLYQIPLKGNEQFTAEVLGNGISNTVNRIKIRYGGLSREHTNLTIAAIGMTALCGDESD